jgi:hypothetical protein
MTGGPALAYALEAVVWIDACEVLALDDVR